MNNFRHICSFLSLGIIICFIGCEPIQNLGPEPQEAFVKIYGGSGNQEGYDMAQSSDGSFLMIGSTSSFGAEGKDIFLVKASTTGNQLWQQSYGGQGDDIGVGIEAMEGENQYLLLTQQTNESGYTDIKLIVVDEQGNDLQVSMPQFGTSSSHELAGDLLKVDDGYLIVGSTTKVDDSKNPQGLDSTDIRDIYIAKIDAGFQLEWERTYGNQVDDQGRKAIAWDNGFLVLGTTDFDQVGGQSSSNFRLLQLDQQGRLLDARTYGNNSANVAQTLIEHTNNSLFIAGGTGQGLESSLLVNLDQGLNALGDPQEITKIGRIYDMLEWDEDRILLTGGSEQLDAPIFLASMNTSGVVDDNIRNFGDSNPTSPIPNVGRKLLKIDENRLAICGTITFGSNTMMCLIKLDVNAGLVPQ